MDFFDVNWLISCLFVNFNPPSSRFLEKLRRMIIFLIKVAFVLYARQYDIKNLNIDTLFQIIWYKSTHKTIH